MFYIQNYKMTRFSYPCHAIATTKTKPATTLQHRLFGVKLAPHTRKSDLKRLGVWRLRSIFLPYFNCLQIQGGRGGTAGQSVSNSALTLGMFALFTLFLVFLACSLAIALIMTDVVLYSLGSFCLLTSLHGVIQHNKVR